MLAIDEKIERKFKNENFMCFIIQIWIVIQNWIFNFSQEEKLTPETSEKNEKIYISYNMYVFDILGTCMQ